MDARGFLLVLLTSSMYVLACAAPQSFKLGAGEVGASFGGYSASAGLGGLLGGRGAAGGGLHAEAGTPGGPAAAAGLGGLLSGGGIGGGKLYSGATTGGGGPAAAAGLGGVIAGGGGGGGLYSGATSGASSSAGSYGGGYGGGNKIAYGGGAGIRGGFFDRIFDIPISTLNAVNRLLNEGGGPAGVSKAQSSSSSRTKVRGHDGNYQAVTKTKVKSKTKQYATARQPQMYAPQFAAQGGAYSSASSSASSGVAAGGVAVGAVKPGGNYDRIFDIPISVLEAVNRLLNGNGRK